jgi:hypothetical protein
VTRARERQIGVRREAEQRRREVAQRDVRPRTQHGEIRCEALQGRRRAAQRGVGVGLIGRRDDVGEGRVEAGHEIR